MSSRNVTSLDGYQVYLTETLTAWSSDRHTAFLAGLAERWFPAYETFSKDEDWGDAAGLRRSLDSVWSHIFGRRLSPADIARHLGLNEDATPHMDDFDAEDALIACIVLRDALRICGELNTLPIAVHAALGVFEGLVEEWPVEPAAEQRVWKKSVVRKELQAQLALIDALAAIPKLDSQSLDDFRRSLAKSSPKPAVKPKPKGPPALTNQTLFEQYRRMVESDLKNRYRDPNQPEPGSYLFAITYLGYWLGRYSRRMQTLNGSYGRWADEPGQRALVERNRACDAAIEGPLDWSADVREAIEMCLSNNVRMNVVDAGSVVTPHPSGPSLRRLWLEGRRSGETSAAAWSRVLQWADHRPACWEAEDRRRKKGLTQSAPELGALLARDIAWKATSDPVFPWSVDLDGIVWRVRINDFPDELLYTLFLGDSSAGDFHDWPECWSRPTKP